MSEPLYQRVARLQHAHPYRFLLGALLVTLGSLPLLSRLELSSDFQAMLPESAPSVRDLDEIRERFGGTATLALAVQATAPEGSAPDVERARELVRELAPRIERMESLSVTSVDWNVGDFERFVREHRHLYADLSDLREIRDSLDARLEYERARASPFFIDLDDEPPPDPEAVIERMQADAREAQAAMDRFPDGFYQHPSEPIVIVFVRTSIRGGETAAIDALVSAIEREATDILGAAPERSRSAGSDVGYVGRGIRIDYGGDTMDVREENEALREAVQQSTVVTLVLLMLSIYVFFFRWRAAFLLLVTLIAPCALAFGIAQPVVGHLNASSAFLGSIVVGNGVNSSIMWLGRYFEERRAGKSPAQATLETHQGTWSGTLAAAVAAAFAYGCLMVTDYRGFRDFGFIGALGMTLCWLAAYLVLPALVLASERIRPIAPTRAGGSAPASTTQQKGIYGVLFAKLAIGPEGSAAPWRSRAVLAVSLLLTVISFVAIARAIASDPLEYDFRTLQAQRPPESRVRWVNDEVVGETVEETRSGSALAILAPRVEDVPRIRQQLEAYREANPNVLGAVRTIDDLMPADVDAKIPLLAELRTLLLEARPYLSEEQQARIDEELPPEHIVPVTRDDLPLAVARPFMERNGTRGRLVFVEHAEGQSTWDGRYMIEWARGVRSVRTEDGTRPAVAGIAVVFADLLASLFSDGPTTIGVSLLATLVLLAFSFRTQRERTLSMAAMLLGALWMTGLLAAAGLKLNFLNMVAFPITFGIGLEYGVNYVKRFQEERATGKSDLDATRAALEGAGGAVILCSLTTLIGYVSLYVSSNRALNSFGYAMSISEITCLATAVLTLPAYLALRAQRTRTPSAEGASEASQSTASKS